MIKKRLYNLLATRSVFKHLFWKANSSKQIYFVMVDPADITHISLIPRGIHLLTGPDAVTGGIKGPFDHFKFPFNKHFMFRTVKRMLDGGEWKATPYYKKLIKKKSHGEAIIHLEKLHKIIYKLTNDGYLSQHELENLDQTLTISKWKVPKHEIMIGMDRYGRLIRLQGARHRLAVAQNIGIPHIPAILTLYHKQAEHLLPVNRRKITGKSEDFNPVSLNF